MHLGLTDRGRALGAAGLTLVASGLSLGFEDLTRVGLVAVFAVVVAAIWVTISRPAVDVHPGSPGNSLMVGQVATLPMRVRATRRTPTFRMDQPLPSALGGEPALLSFPSLPRQHALDVTLTLSLNARGLHDIPPCSVLRDDPFGLAQRRFESGQGRTILVLPRVHPFDATTATGGGRRLEDTVTRMSPQPGHDHGDIRDYRPGDDLRRIHWPATAHRGQLMTRHDERSTSRHAVLVVDPRLADRAAPALLEWGVEMVASTAVALDRVGMSVELVAPWATPRSGAGTSGTPDGSGIESILSTLATTPAAVLPPRVQPAGDDPFAMTMHQSALRSGLVVLVAGIRDPGIRGLLLALPPGITGFVCLLSATGEDRELTAIARQAGWIVQACSPRTDHVQTWRSLLAEARS